VVQITRGGSRKVKITSKPLKHTHETSYRFLKKKNQVPNPRSEMVAAFGHRLPHQGQHHLGRRRRRTPPSHHRVGASVVGGRKDAHIVCCRCLPLASKTISVFYGPLLYSSSSLQQELPVSAKLELPELAHGLFSPRRHGRLEKKTTTSPGIAALGHHMPYL
jgi:hypothetical protein